MRRSWQARRQSLRHGLEGQTRVLRQFEASGCGRRPAACASEVARQACDVTSTPERQLNPPSSRLFSGAAWAFARCWLLRARRCELAGTSRGVRTTSPGACTRPLTRAPSPAPARPEHVRRTRPYLNDMSAVSKSGALRPHTGCGGLRTRRSRPPWGRPRLDWLRQRPALRFAKRTTASELGRSARLSTPSAWRALIHAPATSPPGHLGRRGPSPGRACASLLVSAIARAVLKVGSAPACAFLRLGARARARWLPHCLVACFGRARHASRRLRRPSDSAARTATSPGPRCASELTRLDGPGTGALAATSPQT